MAEILFRPDLVDDVLTTLPTLASALPPPADEGIESTAFPGMRKTQREIYRFLSNTHYDHLVEALRVFETAHAAGCSFGHLLSTSGRQMFASLTAEVLVAEHFLGRGFQVATIPTTGARAPDLHVTGNGVDIAIEVYSPREWLEIGAWMDALQDFLKYVDVPSNFHASAHTKLIDRVGPNRVRAPWEIAAMLRQTSASVFDLLSTDVLVALSKQQPLQRTHPHSGTEFETSVTLEGVRPSTAEGLSRTVATSPPGYIGYAPASVFAHVVANACKKARRRQALGSTAPTRGLLVNLMHAQIADDLLSPPHTAEAESVLEGLDPTSFGLDLMAFYVRALPGGVAAIFSVYENTRITGAQLREMLGSSPS